MSDAVRSVLLAIQRSIDEFVADRSDIGDLQESLAAYASVVDQRLSELSKELRDIDADLEEIQFTMLRDEQRPAALLRLERVQYALGVTLSRWQSDL